MKKENLNQKLAKNLTPINSGRVGETNAIEEFSVVIFFPKETPIENMDNFQNIHTSILKEDFPKFEKSLTNSVEFSMNNTNSSIKTSEPIISGFSFEAYKENGNLKRRIRGENTGEYSWLAINILDYKSWTEASKEYFKWLGLLEEELEKLKVLAVKVQFNDSFIWGNMDNIPYNEIINEDTRYIAKICRENIESLSSSLIEYVKNDNIDYRDVYSIQLAELRNNLNETKKININTPFTREYKEVISFKELIKDSNKKLKETLNYMHDENKGVIRNILSKEVLRMINLEDN